MSRYISPIQTRRSTSFSATKTPRRSINELINTSQTPNQNQSYPVDDQFYLSEKYSARGESNNLPNKSMRVSYDPEISLSIEVDRLKTLNQELKSDNRVLAHKLVENNEIQDRTHQLETQNKQLMKDISKKEELLYYKSQEILSLKQEGNRTKRSQSGFGDILAQNKALIDEISSLKGQLESAHNSRKALEAKFLAPNELEDQLRCANAQVEMLARETNRKTFEIEVLSNQVCRLKSENEKSQDESKEKIQALEIEKLIEENERLQEALKEESRRTDSIGAEIKGIRNRLDEKEGEVDELNHKLMNFQELEEEIRTRGKNVEKIIREKSNEAMKQMLQEKIRYERRINELEETVRALEVKAADNKIRFEEDQKFMEQEIRRVQEEKESLRDNSRRSEEDQSEYSQMRTELNLQRHHRAEKALESVINEKINIRKLLESHIKGSELSLGGQSPIQKGRFSTPSKRVQSTNDNDISSISQYSDLKARAKFEEEIYSLNSTISALEEKVKKYEYELDLLRESLAREQQGRREHTSQEELQEENSLLRLKVSEAQKRLDEVSLQANSSIKECEKLRGLYTQAINQLETEKKNSKKVHEESLNKQDELERGLNQLRRKDMDMRELTIRFEAERKLYSNEIKQLAVLNENTKEELGDLYEISKRRKEECEAYAEHNQRLKREALRLRELLEHYARSNEESNEDFLNLQDTLSSYEKEKDVLKVELERLNTQLEESNVKLSNQVDEVEEQIEEENRMPEIIIRLKGDY